MLEIILAVVEMIGAIRWSLIKESSCLKSKNINKGRPMKILHLNGTRSLSDCMIGDIIRYHMESVGPAFISIYLDKMRVELNGRAPIRRA